ncbi:MAG: WD40 repeat domain-containing protein, partial [Desulfoplanes sp.]
QQFSHDGAALWAIVAPKYGLFTLARDGVAWKTMFPVVTDLVLSPQGARAAALGKDDNEQWTVMVDDTPWKGRYVMAWPPVFSPDGEHVAVKVERQGAYTFVLDGKEMGEGFEHAWAPVFSPDGTKLMLRYIRDNAYCRRVVEIENF